MESSIDKSKNVFVLEEVIFKRIFEVNKQVLLRR